jgi:O-antigen/teichoic acid export membrane protein
MIGGVLETFRHRLAGGLSWSLLAAVSLQGSVLLSSVIVARILGLASFGAYAVLVTTVMTVAAIAQGGSGLVATKFVGEHLASDPRRVARVLRMCRDFTLATGSLASLVLMVVAEPLSRELLQRPELESSARLAALAVFFQVSVSYQYGALQGFGAFMQLGRAGAVAGLAHIAASALGAWLGGLDGALLGFVAASAVRLAAFAVLLDMVRREHRIPAFDGFRPDESRMIWHFALPAGLAGLVTMPCLWLITVFVARMPDGLGLVAILLVAHQVRLVVLQLPSLLNAVSFSVLSRLKGMDEARGFRSVFWSNLAANAAFSVLVVALLILVAEPVMRIYGREFASGRWLLVLLLASVIPEMLAMTFYQLIQSAGRMWQSLLLITIPRDLISLLLASQLLPTLGLVGAGYAHLAGWMFALLAILVTVRRSRLL